MKLRQLSPAVFVALLVASPAVLRADTIYYRKIGVSAIQSVSGTIVQETDDSLQLKTADGRTVSIARYDVYEIIREAPAASVGTRAAGQRASQPAAQHGGQPAGQPAQLQEQAGSLTDFPAASAVASRSPFDDTSSRPPAKYHYGFKGGMSISNVRADPQELEETGSLRGYALGLWWGVPLKRRLMIQAEALFTKKGDSESESGFTTSTQLGYFDLPILARFNLLPDSPIQPSVFAGPSLAFNFSAKSKLEGDGGEAEVDVKDQVGAFDFGLAIGGGLDFAKGGRTYGVDVRYCRGLREIGDGTNVSAHNEAITIMGSVGLR